MELEDIEFEEVTEESTKDAQATPKEPTAEFTDDTGLTDESITEELIREMKMLGMPKPSGVSNVRWNAIMNENIVHNHMIHMRAAGASYTKIAESLGYSPNQVAQILKTPKIAAKVNDVVKDIYGDDYKKAMNDRAHKAMAIYDRILDDDTVPLKLQLQAAEQVVAYTIGKPQQTVEHKGSALTDIMQAVNQLQEAREVGEPLTETEVALDNLVKDIIPKGLVVGKRDTVEKK